MQDTKIYDQLLLGHVVLHDCEIPKGYVAIHGGLVADVGDATSGHPEASVVEDFGSNFLLPGCIDAQTHSRSQKDNEDFIWSTRTAAAGGVTTIVDMPYDAGLLICNAERFNQKKQQAAEQARVDFALYGTAHPEEGSTKLAELAEAGAIGYKFSTFGTDPDRFPRIPPYQMHDCFKTVAELGLVCGVHNEDDESVKHLIEQVKAQGKRDYQSHTLSRPKYTENLAIAQVYELGADTGCRAHIVHCSNKRGIDICKSFQDQGFESTTEVCLHYFTLCEEEDVARLVGKGKVNPPIRDGAEREALWQHLDQGNITAVSTDHVSWSEDRKNKPNMFENASGATGLELLLTLMLTGAEARDIAFHKVVKALSWNVARLFKLDNCKGALEVGKDADIAVVRREPYQYKATSSGHSFTDWSPYDGRTVNYRVSKTMLRGQWIFDGKDVLAEPGSGQFVSPLTKRAN
ncbi:dihydroorotase [Reinekea marinisedimentorum]|uniref:Allantoinase n=1 Tax=Reinekea marinisedimentorum TaxID=230495 RepID=A0A4R3HU05_9GAMM|nr:amidohydrolase family protein [Reinekea marinisedimentorum]TCS36687.1 allantoinase [Reinekea marinisedimentorum]